VKGQFGELSAELSSPVVSSWIASVYSIAVQASSPMLAIAALMFSVSRGLQDHRWIEGLAASLLKSLD
jgi:hypothetical protein